jgi:hypothetical protein
MVLCDQAPGSFSSCQFFFPPAFDVVTAVSTFVYFEFARQVRKKRMQWSGG